MLLIPQSVFSFDDMTLQGNGLGKNNNSQIYLDFDDDKVNGYLMIDNGGEGTEKLILENPKLKTKKNGFLIIDENKNIIYGKLRQSGDFIIVSRINFDDQRQRIIFMVNTINESKTDKPIQRDLLAEFNNNLSQIESKTLESENFKEKQLREKREKLEKEAFEFQQNQEIFYNSKKLQQQKNELEYSDSTKLLIAKAKNDLQGKSAKQLREELAYSNESQKLSTTKFNNSLTLVIDSPHNVSPLTIFSFSGYVFDLKLNDGNSCYGNACRVSDVNISGNIKDVNDKIIYSIAELTGNDGSFAGSYFIPNTFLYGEYTLSIHAEKKIGKNLITDKITKSFFVINKDNSRNLPPISVVNLNQIIYFNFSLDKFTNLSLNGDGSYDPESRPLSYIWQHLNPVNNIITLTDFDTISPDVKIKDVKQKDIFDFSLVVNDGRINSEPALTSITAINDTLKIVNGVLHDFRFDMIDENYESVSIFGNYNIVDEFGYGVHIVGDLIESGKINMTINHSGKKYDVVDVDITDGQFNNIGLNVNAEHGVLSSFDIANGMINNYLIGDFIGDYEIIDGTVFNLHKINDIVVSGYLNATITNGTEYFYRLSFVDIDHDTFVDGFFDVNGINRINGIIERLLDYE